MTLLLGFAAVNTGNNLLYLLVSALLGFMAVSGVLGKGNLSRLQVRLSFPAEIYAGRPASVRVRVENRRRRLPVFLLQIALPGSDALFHVIGAGEAAEAEIPYSFTRRGRHRLEQVQVRSIFPINFFVRTLTLPVDCQVVAFPAPRPCAPRLPGGEKAYRGESAATAKGHQGEITRIVDYRGDQPLKLIHWKLSARSEELKVKELAEASAEPVMLDFETLPGSTVEERLGAATFLINRCAREQRPVGLQIGQRRFSPMATRLHRLQLLTELGLYPASVSPGRPIAQIIDLPK